MGYYIVRNLLKEEIKMASVYFIKSIQSLYHKENKE